MGCLRTACAAAVMVSAGLVAPLALASGPAQVARPGLASPQTDADDTRVAVHRWAAPRVDFRPDGTVVAGGQVYANADEYVASPFFRAHGMRCLVNPTEEEILAADALALRGSPSDCSASNTNPAAQYDFANGPLYRIPVVVHVIQTTSGTGFIPVSRVQSQIEILNEDFRALPGTNGAPGTDTGIEFYLATEDPSGNPTTGITYSTNNTWFNDSGSYWNTLAWDPDRYLNIYTNSASGALGYVPFLPASSPSSIGSNADRVVVLHSSFGRNAPIANYDLGRTATHEVGHYLGLYHTFTGGCASGSCYNGGDRICDTNNESQPFFGCSGGRFTCSSPDPIDNYMNYSYDICMNKFTPEQAKRMRCTLENYRQTLYEIVTQGPCSDADIATEGGDPSTPDGLVTLSDFSAYLALWSANNPVADITADALCAFGTGGDGVTLADFSCYIAQWSAGCP